MFEKLLIIYLMANLLTYIVSVLTYNVHIVHHFSTCSFILFKYLIITPDYKI